MRIWLFLSIILLLISSYLCAQDTTITKRIYRVTRTNPHPPKLDGLMNDVVWGKSAVGGNFIQTDPHEGKAPSEPTEFRICYDNSALYVFIRAYDRNPDKIVRRVTRRDEGRDADFVAVLIDSYHDQRTAFQFAVNAAGVKIDAIWSEDGDNRDNTWDPVWEVKTKIDESGWSAEMRIPLSQLRFSRQEEPVWGLQVVRYFYREKEWSMWQFYPQDASGFVKWFGELHGLQGLKPARRIELLPYGISQLTRMAADPDDPFSDRNDGKVNGGLDGKIGVASNITLDFTVNPDFGQVEADPSEVNLSAFETFFEEKRPFFIEGRNIFNYGLGWGDGDNSRETLFYSRRMGRRPHYSPDLDDDVYAQAPDNTSIITAAKITGKTNSGISIGILNAVTAEESAQIDSFGVRRRETVEPLTNYFVGRLQKDYDGGNTSIGGIVTAVNRDISDPRLKFLNTAAYSGGLDLNHQWHNKDYFISVKTAFSRIEGDPEAILEAQTSSQRYFQRPDADHVHLDSSRAEMMGHGGSIALGKVGGGHWRYVLGGVWRSPGFEINDLGFLKNADQNMNFLWASYREWQPKGPFRSFQINVNAWNGINFGGERLFSGGNINGGGRFNNYWRFWTGINRSFPGLRTSALRGGPALRTTGGWNNFYNVFSDDRKPVILGTGGFNHFNDDGVTRRHNLWAELTWRPQDAVSLSMRPFYSFNKDNLQYVTTEEADGGDRYVFARLQQKTFGVVFRANVSITPDLSIQFYGQPFLSAGNYTHFKQITDSRADRYEDRFREYRGELSYDAENNEYAVDENRDGEEDYRFENPNFNFQEFRSNLILRWEFRPGSTFFLVWAQNRSQSSDSGLFSLRNDFDSLFSADAENIFLVKFNYWFSL